MNQTGPSTVQCDVANQRISTVTGYVSLAIDAVTAYAYAIRNLQMSLCNGSGLCKASLSTGDSQSRLFIHGDLLKPYLLNVNFQSDSGANFTFDKNGDPARVLYTMQNLQIKNESYSYVPILDPGVTPSHWSSLNQLCGTTTRAQLSRDAVGHVVQASIACSSQTAVGGVSTARETGTSATVLECVARATRALHQTSSGTRVF